jgi:Flp pilus assembly protein TadD
VSTQPAAAWGPRVIACWALAAAIATSGCASAVPKGTRVGTPPAQTSSTLGGSSMESHDPVLADALVRVLVRRTPEHLAAAAYRYYQLGIRDTAMDHYAASLKMDRRYAPALDGAARIWRDWGQLGRALSDAYRATYFAPNSPAAWNTLGTVLQLLGQADDAAAAYRRAAAIDPSAAYARSNLCYLALLQGQAAEARAECTAAIDADGRFVQAGNNLALVHAASGDAARAFDAFAAAGGEAAAHYNIGIVLLAERQYDAAVLAFEAAYHAEPEFEKAHERARYARRQARAAGETTHDRR